MLIDTPGMRELGNFSVETGLAETFTEIVELSEQCLFNDCTHVNEKGCAVLKAMENGQIPKKRYQNYIKMKKVIIVLAMMFTAGILTSCADEDVLPVDPSDGTEEPIGDRR